MSEDLNLHNLDANEGELDKIGNTENTENTEVKKEETVLPQGTTDKDLMLKVFEFLKSEREKSSVEVYGADGENYVNEKDIDVDDMLEHPVVFFAHKAGYVIVDDTRRGVKQNNPYHKRAIVFKYVFTKRIWHGKEQDIEHLCQYVCKSKKEAEWLRGHSQFGITFFDKMDANISQNAELAVIASKYMNRVRDMDAHQVRKISQDLGISVSQDTMEQRQVLAVYYAEEEVKANRAQHEKRVGNAIVEQELLR